jgi:hypothetical protein
MGFMDIVESGVHAASLGTIDLRDSGGGPSGSNISPLDPAIFEHEKYEGGPAITMQPFDYSRIGSVIKQAEATTGRAINDDIVGGAVKGVIESRIGPTVALAESAADRKFRGEEAVKGRNLSRDRMQLEKWGAEKGFAITSEQMRREQEAAETAGKAAFGQTIGMLAGMALAAPTGGMSMAVGGMLGGAAGGSAGAMSVLCTELHRQGYISKRELVLSNRFREDHVGVEAYTGYLLWASPVVDMMKESKVITSIVKSIWMPVVYHMVGKKTLRGKLTYKALSLFSLGVLGYQMRKHMKKEVAHA